MNVFVVHPAQQHSYRLATALYQKNMLGAYVTTVYYKKRNLTGTAVGFLHGNFKKKAESRRITEVPDEKVIQFCEGEGLLKLLAMNVRKLNRFYKPLKYHTADRFARKAARYAIRHQVDAVITYDDCSPLLFEILAKKAPQIKRILDMSAANLHYMKRVYEEDMLIRPDFSELLKKERAIIWDEAVMDRAMREIKASQYFLAPSSFVEDSLLYSGVNKAQIFRCPYGVDVSRFACKKYTPTEERPLEFIYVGGVKELKGISYLLDAFYEVPIDQAHLTVVGSYNKEDPFLKKYLDKVTFTGMMLHSQVAEFLNNSDVYIFPSLGEGLSLSTLEAAACGLPLIVSQNSGVNDAITVGKEGFIVPIQNSQALREKIEFFIQNRNQIEQMGKAARKMALQYTWDRYYKTAADIVDHIVQAEEL